MMLFPRHRKAKRLDDPPTSTTTAPPKKSSLADAFFRKLPIAFTRRTRSKTSLLSDGDASGLLALPRHSTSLPNVNLEACSSITTNGTPRVTTPSTSTTTTPNPSRSYKRQRCVTSTNEATLNHRRHSLLFEDLLIQKRHSIEPRVYRFSKIINYDNDNDFNSKQRHSYTFGKHQEMKNLSLKDLMLDPTQEKKLDIFLEQRQAQSPPSTPKVTNSSTMAAPAIIIPQRSASHQLLSPPRQLLIRAHSTSSSSIHQQQEDTSQYQHSPLDGATLRHMLDYQDKYQQQIILIDVRNLVDYQKQRICGSLNVNLPSLLIKRYQRGTVSNFHLENFITTAEGREQYMAQRQSSTASNTSSSTTLPSELAVSSSSLSSSPSSISTSPLTPTLSSSSVASNGSNPLPGPDTDTHQLSNSTIWVVYDDDMNEQNKATQAWTLLNVLCKATSDTNDRVHYLLGGFYGFINGDNHHDTHRWLEGIDNDMRMNCNLNDCDSNDMDLHHHHQHGSGPTMLLPSTSSGTPTLQQKLRNKVSPRRSLSYTIGDGSKAQQQTSLFSLDTQAARENNANALARRASRRSQQLQHQLSVQLSTSTPSKCQSTAPRLNFDSKGNNNNNSIITDSSLLPSNTSIQQSHNLQNEHCIDKNNGEKTLLSIPSLHSELTTLPSYSSSASALPTSIQPASTSLALITPNTISPPSTCATAVVNNTNPSILARVMEEDDDDDDVLGQMTADISPRTETDFEFTISEIIPGFLYVGPEIETNDQAEQLLARPIRRVLNMAEECHDQPLMKHQDYLMYRKIAARDTVEMRNIDHIMMEAVGFIEEAKRNHEPTYVHCKAGKSRSVTVILAYLVSCEKWTLKQSYRHVIKARPNMSPNIGFIAELMKLENQVHGRVSSFLETDWQTSSLPSPGFSQELQQLQLAWQQSPSSPTKPPSSLPASPIL